jgi:hypothetical protein
MRHCAPSPLCFQLTSPVSSLQAVSSAKRYQSRFTMPNRSSVGAKCRSRGLGAGALGVVRRMVPLHLRTALDLSAATHKGIATWDCTHTVSYMRGFDTGSRTGRVRIYCDSRFKGVCSRASRPTLPTLLCETQWPVPACMYACMHAWFDVWGVCEGHDVYATHVRPCLTPSCSRPCRVSCLKRGASSRFPAVPAAAAVGGIVFSVARFLRAAVSCFSRTQTDFEQRDPESILLQN